MPWNGSGTYTRGYASWASDAAANLPISATKFDTEDNDFAAGIQNCLTIDGQNKPNTTLTWSQALALTKGSDATIFSLARTGGTNNPSLTYSVADATGFTQSLSFGSYILTMPGGHNAFNFATGAYSWGNTTDNPTYTFLGSGAMAIGGRNVTVTAPSVGIALSINGAANSDTILVTGSSTVGQSYGIVIAAGTNSTDSPFVVANQSLGATFFRVRGDGVVLASDLAASPTLTELGYKDIPQNGQTISYQLVLSDRGKGVDFNGNSITCTIPANASVAFPIGSTIVITNLNASNLSIAITSDTLTLAGSTTTGTRTLAQNGTATIRKVGTTSWLIAGTGIT